GLLGSAFTLVYAIGALPFGLWADRGVRPTVIGTGVPNSAGAGVLRDGRAGTRVCAACVPNAGAGARRSRARGSPPACRPVADRAVLRARRRCLLLPTLLNRRFGMSVGEAGTLAGGVIV